MGRGIVEPDVDDLIGRAADLAALDHLLADAAAGTSQVRVVHGPAGIGKTSLLHAVQDRADGWRVLTATAVQAESALPYAALLSLLEPLVDRFDTLPGRQGAALRGAFALGAPVAGDRFAVALAALTLLAEVAAGEPLLVVVDDVQWVDAESAQAIAFVARRLRAERICLLLGHRAGIQPPVDLSGLPRLDISPLDERSAHRLLAVTVPEVTAQVARRLVSSAAGNPYALIELARALSPGQLGGTEPIGPLPPVRPEIEDLVRRRVAEVAPQVRQALLVASAAASGIADRVSAAGAALGLPADALDEAVAAGLLRVESDRLQFSHPLVRSAVYQLASPSQRRQVHRVLADVAAAVGDTEVEAWHLAHAASGPDESTARVLDVAGDRARSRGAHATAATALAAAARLSENAGQRGRRLAAAAESALLAGQVGRAASLLAEAADAPGDEETRLTVATLQARLALMTGHALPGAVDALEEAGRLREESDPTVSVQAYADAAALAIYARQLERAVRLGDRAVTVAARGDDALRATADVASGVARSWSGRAFDADALVRGVSRPLGTGADPLRAVQLLQQVVAGLASARRHAEAARHAQRFITAAREVGAVGVLPLALCLHANTVFWSGDWDAGQLSAAEALRLAESTDQPAVVLFACVCLAHFDASRGRRAEAERLARRALQLMDATGVELFRVPAHATLGLAAQADGDVPAAVAAFDEAYRLHGLAAPTIVHWKADYAEALAAAGREQEVAAMLATMDRRAAEPEGLWERAMQARGRAVAGLSADAAADFAAAVALYQQIGVLYPQARTLLAWGEQLAAAGDARLARPRLSEALELFERVHAHPWAERARQALAGLGVPVTVDEQSQLADLPAETQQIARLVAAGASVPDAARQLFVGEPTARALLREAMQALDVTTVDGLRAAGGELPAPADDARHHVRLLGDFALRVDGAPVGRLGDLPGQAVKFVALSGAVHVDELVEALWPETDPEVGRRRLRNVLTRVRAAAGGLLERTGDAVRLAAGVPVDVHLFRAEADAALAATDDGEARRRGQLAVSAYAGELLPADRFVEWTAAPRERLHRRYLQVLDRLAAAAEADGDLAAAARWTETAIDADPYGDARYLAAIRLLQAAGLHDRASALHGRAWQVARSLGVPPPPALDRIR